MVDLAHCSNFINKLLAIFHGAFENLNGNKYFARKPPFEHSPIRTLSQFVLEFVRYLFNINKRVSAGLKSFVILQKSFNFHLVFFLSFERVVN
ncbi:hypothetical protein LguiB_013244 [Lonicera macranthoides]